MYFLTLIAANLPEILSSNVINLLISRASSTNEDLRMKFCWAINNLCVHGTFFHFLSALVLSTVYRIALTHFQTKDVRLYSEVVPLLVSLPFSGQLTLKQLRRRVGRSLILRDTVCTRRVVVH